MKNQIIILSLLGILSINTLFAQTPPKIEILIDGQSYTQEQLKRYEYERTLHSLHEMKRLGAEISDNGKPLSHIDINWLEPKDAEHISVETRSKLGEDGVLELFKDVLADSDQRWKTFNQVPIAEQGVQTCEVDLFFPEMTLNNDFTLSKIGDTQRKVPFNMMSHDILGYLKTYPEHYMRSMECIGLFGEPVLCSPVPLRDIPDYVPVVRHPDYPICGSSEVNLKDGTPMHLGAIHQFRITEKGLHVKSIFFCPNNAPKAISEGHKLHFAIELINDISMAYRQLSK